jgi:catechol 2,3-dioxygenase-like lactoylglutathione lyase family enzyme
MNRRVLFLLSALASGFVSPARASDDPLAAKSALDPVAASPLRGVTIAATDVAASRRFYGDALGMTASPAMPLAPTQARHLGIGGKPVSVLFTRPATADAVNVRVVTAAKGAPVLRPTHNALAPGGLAMGMPVAGQAKREAIVTAAGFRSAVGVTSMTLPRGDGQNYTVEEIHYQGPDGVLVLGIDRGTMTPVGPIDAISGIGGPAYGSIVVDDLVRTDAFLTTVLRYEMRRDAVFTSAGPKGGLGLAEGQRFAFQQWYAPGSATGYLVVLKMLDRAAEPPQPGGFARRGIVMWTFDAADLTDVADRAESVGARIVARPGREANSLIVAMRDGFLVEFVPRKGAKR